MKGGPTLLDNYRPISKLCILSKLLESFISEQLTQYLHSHKLLSINQSGFRKKHSTITAVLKVLNDLVKSLDGKHHCACLFIDLTKAFDTVKHKILLDKLRSVGLSDNVVSWFNTYLKGRTQCVQVEVIKSDLLEVGTGVPQGSVLGPLLFIIYINCLDVNIDNARFHFYADDTVIYCSAPTKQQALGDLQSAFDIIQASFFTLKLVLNVEKTKFMWLSNSRNSLDGSVVLRTPQGKLIALVSEYKYLGIIIDDTLRFNSYINYLRLKLKKRLGFYFRNKSFFSFNARKKLVSGTFLPILDYGVVVYQHASSYLLASLEAVYHGALRFITDCKFSTHHCILYNRVAWSSLAVRRKMHWYLLIYKAILFFLPSYLCCLIHQKVVVNYSLRSQSFYNLHVPSARTNLGKIAFEYAAPSDWNSLQMKLRLNQLVSLCQFKTLLRTIENGLMICKCF